MVGLGLVGYGMGTWEGSKGGKGVKGEVWGEYGRGVEGLRNGDSRLVVFEALGDWALMR